MYNIVARDAIEVVPAVVNRSLKGREERNQIGMILTHNKKGQLISFRLRYSSK